jgi:dihydroorotate dehydrogenase electron transfer subunit
LRKKTRKAGMSRLSVTGDYNCTVIRNKRILPGVHKVEFECVEISSSAFPGQFVQVEPAACEFPVTRRPITINNVTETGFELLFDAVGHGTGLMSKMQPGDAARILGPLGKGWVVDFRSNWLLIGGGLGAAGFQFLLDSVDSATVVIGASDLSRVVPVKGAQIVTEDGSSGAKGLVTSLVTEELLRQADSVAVCGPVAMMEAVWRVIPEKHRAKVQVSTESRMGCGWGVCDGCSIPVSGGGYRKCCTEGPVFHGAEIDWKRWKEAGL